MAEFSPKLTDTGKHKAKDDCAGAQRVDEDVMSADLRVMGAKVTMPGWLRQAESILKHHKPVTREVIISS